MVARRDIGQRQRRVRAVGRPGAAGQLQRLLRDRPTLRPQPGQHIRRQLADTDKPFHPRHRAYLHQLQARRQAFEPRQGAHQKQLVIRIGLAPQHARSVAQLSQLSVFVISAPTHVGQRQVEGLADELAALLTIGGCRQVLHRAHAQGVGHHLKTPAEPGKVQGVFDIVTAAPVAGIGFVTGSKVRMPHGKIDGVDMRFELGPTAEAQLPGDQPLRAGQRRRRMLELGQLRGCGTGLELTQKLFGAFFLLLEVEPAVVRR